MSYSIETSFNAQKNEGYAKKSEGLLHWMKKVMPSVTQNDCTRLLMSPMNESHQAQALVFAKKRMEVVKASLDQAIQEANSQYGRDQQNIKVLGTNQHDAYVELAGECEQVIKVLNALDGARAAASPDIQDVRHDVEERAEDCQFSYALTNRSFSSPARVNRECNRSQADADQLIVKVYDFVRSLLSLQTEHVQFQSKELEGFKSELNVEEVLRRYFHCEENEDGELSYSCDFSSSFVLGTIVPQINPEDLELWQISPVACILYWLFGVVLKSIDEVVKTIENDLLKSQLSNAPKLMQTKTGLEKFGYYAEKMKEHDASVCDAKTLLKAFG